MARKPALILLFIISVVVLAAWGPWVTISFAEVRAEAAFQAAWQGVVDGCGFNCTGCGATGMQKIWFGYRVRLEYACGMLPEDSAEYHEFSDGFVSFLGTVHGFPTP